MAQTDGVDVTHTALLTLTTAAISGVMLVVIAERLSIPSIALLLLGGVALGPEFLGWVQPAALGAGLEIVIALAVAVILFEGGMTLDVSGYRRAPTVIKRMLTVGVLITWFGTSLAMWAILDVDPMLALLGGSLVIVTGPTVVSPLLRRIGVQDRVHHVLYWEAVLIDAIGVFVAALVFEWMTTEHGVGRPMLDFLARLVVGLLGGAAGGIALAWVLRLELVSEEHVNIVALAFAAFLFGACDAIAHESGILAVIVAGLLLGVLRPPQLRRLRRFKLELTELGIGTLFILLSARLELHRFLAYGAGLAWLLVVLLLVVRPLDVFVSTAGQRFRLRERLFLSWVAPRGIVAASMASLFALKLSARGVEDARLIETFTFAVIGTTVLVQGLSAPWVARLLKVEKPPRSAWLLCGEDRLALGVARALGRLGVDAVVVGPAVSEGEALDPHVLPVMGLPTSRELADDPRLMRVASVLALSPDVTEARAVCSFWGDILGRAACHRLAGSTVERATLNADGEPTDGALVWRHLPGPVELDAALGPGGEGELVAVTAGTDDRGRFHEGFAPVFVVSSDRAAVVADPLTHVPAPGERVLVLRRRVPGLEGLVRGALVVDEPDSDLYRVVRQLLEAAGEGDPDLPVEDLLEEILERERSMSTAMGLGVIIPHTYHPGVDRVTVMVANVTRGLRADGPGGELIHLVFLVLSPYGRAEAHLLALAAIARLVSDSDYRGLLGRQRDPEGLLDLIRERE